MLLVATPNQIRYRQLGRTGLKVSEICAGTITFGRSCDENTARAIMDVAFEGGVNLFDTADTYPSTGPRGRSEEIVGRWLKGKRHEVLIATKGYQATGKGPNDQGLSRKHIFQAIDASLRRLQTDYVDLYQVHHFDPTTPMEETLRALDDLVRQGKVLYLGCSNHASWQITKALLASQQHGLARYDSVQVRYNILFRDEAMDLFPLCQDQGIGALINHALAAGVLSGKYSFDQPPPPGSRLAYLPPDSISAALFRKRYWHRDQLEAVTKLKEFFDARGKSMPQVAVAWLLAQPVISSAIIGSSSPEQFTQILAAAAIHLDEEELRACDDAWYSLPRLREQ